VAAVIAVDWAILVFLFIYRDKKIKDIVRIFIKSGITAYVIILTPILLAVITKIGVSPIHFGIVMTIALAIGISTPPVAINLIYM